MSNASRALRPRLFDDERGAVAVLVALSMTLLFFFAAIAVDATGFGFNERRQAQSAADVASLAAVQFAVPDNLGHTECAGLTGLARSRCNGAVEAMAVANATLDDPSLVDWTDPSRCPAPPAGFTVSAPTSCVAFNFNNQRAWVSVPLIDKPTTLARAVGINSIAVSADATAGAGLGGKGAVLPFLLPGNAVAANHNCLKAGSNPNFGPCADLPTMGNFQAMDFRLYGNADLGWTAVCGAGFPLDRFNTNIARGVDHPLGVHPTGSGSGKLDSAFCPDWSAEPDMTESVTGNVTIDQGMLYGGSYAATSPYPGRIQSSSGVVVRRSHPNGTPAARVDDTPLWSFLLPFGAPHACHGVSTPAQMEACIAWAKSTSTVIFNDDLASSIRFGFTPEVWEFTFNPGSSAPYHIKGFLPIYVDTTLFGCNANSCDIMHTPGIPDQGNCPSSPAETRITCGTNPPTGGDRNAELRAVTAYILSTQIVPANAVSPSPGADNQRRFNLID